MRSAKASFWRGVLAGVLGGLVLSAGVVRAAGITLFAPVVGKVNGTPITESQMLWYLFSRDSEDVVKDLVFYSLVAQEAPALGVSVDPAKAEEILASMHGERGPLVFNALNKAEVKTALLRELTAREVMKAMKVRLAGDPQYAVTEEEVVNAYLQNAAKMQIPEQVYLSVINTSSLKKAESALTAIKSGTPFADAAKQFSEDDVTKDIGGQIDRPIPKGIYFRGPFKKLDDIAFRLPKGQHSEIIAAADQFFIIQVNEKVPAKDITLEEARPKLKQTIEEFKVAPAIGDWLQTIGEQADLQITYPIFEVSSQDLRNLNEPSNRRGAAANGENAGEADS